MVEDMQRQNHATSFETRPQSSGHVDDATTVNLFASSSGSRLEALSTENAGVILLQAENEMPSIDPRELNDRQYRAYQIIIDHLTETIAGRSLRPLRMMYGEGGMGKSKVIQTVRRVCKSRYGGFLICGGKNLASADDAV
jgi:hypothetical protein